MGRGERLEGAGLMTTFGQFKKHLEDNGVSDEMEINYIDLGPMTTGVELYIDTDGTFRVVGSYGGPDYVEDDRKEGS